jgi:hypothetical protein
MARTAPNAAKALLASFFGIILVQKRHDAKRIDPNPLLEP